MIDAGVVVAQPQIHLLTLSLLDHCNPLLLVLLPSLVLQQVWLGQSRQAQSDQTQQHVREFLACNLKETYSRILANKRYSTKSRLV